MKIFDCILENFWSQIHWSKFPNKPDKFIEMSHWYRLGHGGVAVLLPGFAISW